MRPIGETNFDARTSAANAAWRSRALQKPSAAADLRGEQQDEPEARPHQFYKNQTPASPQNGTEGDVPFRYAPRLTAAFTAQLLGQLLPDSERRHARVYESPAPVISLGLDSRL